MSTSAAGDAEFARVVLAARKAGGVNPDPSNELKAFMREHPEVAARFDLLRRTAEDSIFSKVNGAPIESAIIKTEVANVRRSLGYNESSEIEKLIIYQVSLAWALVQVSQVAAMQGSGSIHSLEFWDKRTARAEARLCRTLDYLVRIRKILSSPLQLDAR